MCRECYRSRGVQYDPHAPQHGRLNWWYAGKPNPGWPPVSDGGPWLVEDRPPRPDTPPVQPKAPLGPPRPDFLKGLSNE